MARRRTIGAAATLAVALAAAAAFAHPGGLDAHGCHHDRATGLYHCHHASPAASPRSTAGCEPIAGPQTTVTKVIDGDTLIVAGGRRIRLIGVDTPETVHPRRSTEYFGREASAFTRRTAYGKEVRLDYDPANAGSGHRDKYGRTLAYVRLPDGSSLNGEIIRQGYGFAYTRFPFCRLEEFRAYEREASAERRGMWAP
jgi:micrococcal nuclease